MTGNSVAGTSNNIIDKQSEIDRYYECFAPKKSVREQIRAYQSDNDTLPDIRKIIETMCKHNRKAKGLFEGTIASGDASKDDFLLLLLLNSYTHGDEALMEEIFLMSALNRSDDRSKRKNEVAYIRYLEDSIKKLFSMEIKDTGTITITEKVQVITVNDWLKLSDDELSDYLNRELEYTDKGQLKSNTTNLITVLVNPLFCKEEEILDGTIFFDTCSMTVRFFGRLKGEKHKENEIRKWNDHLTNLLGVEIEREFGIKYSKNRMDDAITFIAHKRAVNLPAMYMK